MPKLKKSSTSKKLPNFSTEIEETHPWRTCPLGQHPVREHERRVSVSVKNPDGTTSIRFQCRHYPSRKDHLYPLDIKEVAEDHFHKVKKLPRKVDWKSKEWHFSNQNEYDSLIGGWTEYWNIIFTEVEPLDPDLVKAIIASESGFDPEITNKAPGDIARGLMQVMDSTRKYLGDPKQGELKDHFVNLTDIEAFDPNMNIAAGVRWLFRKREVAKVQFGREPSWLKTVFSYKGYAKSKTQTAKKQKEKISKLYEELKK